MCRAALFVSETPTGGAHQNCSIPGAGKAVLGAEGVVSPEGLVYASRKFRLIVRMNRSVEALCWHPVDSVSLGMSA